MSVLPFLAAVQTGVVGKGELQVNIQVPAEASQDYCSSYTDCSTKHPEAMTKWQTFFQVLCHLSMFRTFYRSFRLVQVTPGSYRRGLTVARVPP